MTTHGDPSNDEDQLLRAVADSLARLTDDMRHNEPDRALRTLLGQVGQELVDAPWPASP